MSDPDEEPVRFEQGHPVELDTDGGLATLRIVLEGGALVRGENTFLVELSPRDPGPAALESVTVFMPAHGHTSDAPRIEPAGEQYRVSGVILYMPGRWEITLHVAIDGARDAVTFPVDTP